MQRVPTRGVAGVKAAAAALSVSRSVGRDSLYPVTERSTGAPRYRALIRAVVILTYSQFIGRPSYSIFSAIS